MPCAQRNPCVFICYTVISTTFNYNQSDVIDSLTKLGKFIITSGQHVKILMESYSIA